jgi:hypothetical protein
MALSCSDARALIRRFLAGGLERAGQEGMRAHVARCAACRSDYTSGAEALAATGREHLRGQREIARAVARARRERDVLEAQRGGGGRPQRLRLLAYPACLALLLWMFGSRALGAGGARVEVVAGPVVAGGALLEAGAAQLGRGEWVATLDGARAALTIDALELRLAPATRVLLERRAPARVRLECGALEVFGAVELVTPGALVVTGAESAARVEVAPGTTRVRCLRGTLSCLDAGGARALDAGEELRLP